MSKSLKPKTIGNKAARTRNWTFVLYPESMPKDYIDVLNSFKTQYIISPLHDKDTNGAEEEKKAHYHVLLCFEGNKTFEQISALIAPLNCPAPQKVHSVKGVVRYFLHLDNPEKHQYHKSDLTIYGGIDVEEFLRPTKSERYAMVAEIMDFIDDNEITEFSILMRYAREKRMEDWFPCLCDTSTYIISVYMKSKHFQAAQKRTLE